MGRLIFRHYFGLKFSNTFSVSVSIRKICSYQFSYCFYTFSIKLNILNSECIIFRFLCVGWDWDHLVRRTLISLLYQPQMIDDDDDDDECGGVTGMRIGRGNRSTRRKPTPVPFCPPQIPHNLIWSRMRTLAVGNRQLTAWGTALPFWTYIYTPFLIQKSAWA
jgi:hypothetical protein